MPRNRSPKTIKTTHQKAKETKGDDRRYSWMCETDTGQQVAKLLGTWMMMMMTMMTMMMTTKILLKVK
jgi:hypothetical protein